MERGDSAFDSPRPGCGHLRVFFISREDDSKDWVQMIDDGAYDGKGHMLGEIRTQLSQEFVFFNSSCHLAIPQRNLLARTAASALHGETTLA